MKERIEFRNRIQSVLAQFPQDVLSFDASEFWMIRMPYEYIEYYSQSHQLTNTAIALPLARGLHDGSHRKSSVSRGGESFRLPYVIHCLLVCRMLIDIKAPLSHEDEDILLAAALCHDMVEDLPFPDHGRELYTQFHLDPRVYETVKLVSKRRDFSEEEERAFFHHIEENPLSLLVKLSDRGNNVEDLYNMSVWKVHEYVGETNKFFLPMCEYGLERYPELTRPIEILREKILILTRVSQVLVDRCEAREQELMNQLQQLREENARLRREYSQLWEG